MNGASTLHKVGDVSDTLNLSLAKDNGTNNQNLTWMVHFNYNGQEIGSKTYTVTPNSSFDYGKDLPAGYTMNGASTLHKVGDSNGTINVEMYKDNNSGNNTNNNNTESTNYINGTTNTSSSNSSSSSNASTTNNGSNTSSSSSTSSNSESNTGSSSSSSNQNSSEDNSTTSNDSSQTSGESQEGSYVRHHPSESSNESSNNEDHLNKTNGNSNHQESTGQSNNQKLPQTGDPNSTKGTTLIGAILIAIAGFFGALFKRKNN